MKTHAHIFLQNRSKDTMRRDKLEVVIPSVVGEKKTCFFFSLKNKFSEKTHTLKKKVFIFLTSIFFSY